VNVDFVTLYTLQASSFDCPSTTVITTTAHLNTESSLAQQLCWYRWVCVAANCCWCQCA
jgi:hypothetical protein